MRKLGQNQNLLIYQKFSKLKPPFQNLHNSNLKLTPFFLDPDKLCAYSVYYIGSVFLERKSSIGLTYY